MAVTKSIKGKDLFEAANKFLSELLEKQLVTELLVPLRSETGEVTIPTVVHDRSALGTSEPLAPVLNGSSANHLVQLTEERSGTKLAAVLRPCEARAVVELIKLKQIAPEDLIVISADCLGTISMRNYSALISGGSSAAGILDQLLKDRFASIGGSTGIRESCKLCPFRESPTADIKLEFIGAANRSELIAVSQSAKGEQALDALKLPDGKEPPGRAAKLKSYGEQTDAFWRNIAPELDAMTGTLDDLVKSIELCIKCHNCMNMCPICYCKECFFLSDPVTPSPAQYTKRAAKKGSLVMPSDRLLFQLGRMNHMITSCVQCGQCLEACPNDVPYLRQFPYMAKRIQAIFEYVAGTSPEAPLPLATFKEDELYPK